MTGLTALWLPILLSAVFVFVLSSVIHMATPWHKNDYPPMPREAEAMDALRGLKIPPGDYMVPRAGSMEALKSPEFAAKLEAGPVFMMTMMPNGPFNMVRNLGMWFVYSLVVSVFAAYVAGRALAPGAEYLHVFRFAGVTAFAGYSLALAQMSIWYRRSWRITLTSMFDGLLYALVSAGAFGWLWPQS